METLIKRFDCWDLTTFKYDGRLAWIAKEIGEALGYGNEGRKLITLIRNQWFSEFIEHHDYKLIEGKNLRDLRALLGVDTRGVSTKTRNLLILFEPGVNTVCLKTNKPKGRVLRRWLADEVLPSLREKGSYTEKEPPAQPPAATKPDPRLEVLRAREERLAVREARLTGTKKAAAILSMINRLKRLGQISTQNYALEVVRAGEVESGIAFGQIRGYIAGKGHSEGKPSDIQVTPSLTSGRRGDDGAGGGGEGSCSGDEHSKGNNNVKMYDSETIRWKCRVTIAAELGRSVAEVIVATRKLRIDYENPEFYDGKGFSPKAVGMIRDWLDGNYPRKSVPVKV